MSATMNEKTTFGAVIEPPRTPQQQDNLSVRDAPPSPLTTSSLPAANPFYAHDNTTNHNDNELKAPPSYIRDVESQHLGGSTNNSALNLSQTKSTSRNGGGSAHDDSMWPSMKSQKAKAKQQKCAKSWNPMARMGKKQKLIVTAVIALFIIGAAVGIGVGISIATGGGVKQANGGNKPIGDKNGS